MEKFQIGDAVLYIPNHAKGDRAHPSCEKGTVSSVHDKEDGTQNVWVRYSFGSTGALTPTGNLVKLT